MADTVAIELVKVIFEKLADEGFKRIARAQGIHKELKEWKSTLSRVQDLLTDASQKEVTDRSVKSWLNSLQHLSYDIGDVLDDVATEAMDRELTQEPGASTSKVRKLIPTCCTNFSLSHRLSPKLDDINTQLENLEKRKTDLGLIKKDEKPKSTSRRSETSLPERDVVGREVEKELLLRRLLSDDGSSQENFSILPIVGMGGIGKTTLARLLYNDTKVKEHFELKAWVCVSDDFDILKISNAIFQSVAATSNQKFEDLDKLQTAIANHFKDKRFLLVVDDVWTESYGDWENLVRPFLSCAPRSRIIMTTRKEQLLKKLGFHNVDHLKSLSHEDALCLFALHALGVGNLEEELKPQCVGIVKKCGCLPLALKAIGRLLRTKGKEDWDAVLHSEIWDVENANDTENGKDVENSDKIIPALRISYHDLSADLKQLFAYCSLFPKDFLFDKEELILLWMAEGFLNPSNATKSPERLGHEYFEILLSRSFFQHAPNDESLFIMHDLMNDLSIFVAGEFFLRFENHMMIHMEALEKHRHLSFTRELYVGHQKFEAFKRARSLRTFLAVPVGVEESWKPFFLSNKILVDLLPTFPLLRVLSLSCFMISELPEFIGSLKHLRYLNLSQTEIVELPENVGNLYHLQTLIVFGCKSLTKLPKSFKKLKKLRHLDIRDTPLLEKLPFGIGELESLQTLTKIIIGGDDGLEINELKGLKNLHGEVSIEGLHKVQSAIRTREANLSLKRITGLELQWVDVFDDSRMGEHEIEMKILNELRPNNDTLKKLSVVSYGGATFSNWVGDPSFHELVDVSIRGCRKCTYLPPFGLLPSLKRLLIQGMDEVKIIGLELTGSEVNAFRSLEVLTFEDMSGWEGWSTKTEGLVAMFRCLKNLHIKKCPKLMNISLEALPSLTVLEMDGCGDGVLRSLVQVASSITKLDIKYISGLIDEVWRGVIGYLREVEELSIRGCNEIKYLWQSETEASKLLVNLKKLRLWECSGLVGLGEKEEEEDNFGSSHLLSVTSLNISSCRSIKCLCFPNSLESLEIYESSVTTLEGGQKLKSLDIIRCDKLEGKMNNTSMPMLETLDIVNWENLRSISELSISTHFTYLQIIGCPRVVSLPDLQLSNLTHLTLFYCESLVSIELSNLTLLTNLYISNCPGIDVSISGGCWPPKLSSLGIGGLRKPISEWGYQNFPTSLVHLSLWHEADVRNFSELSHLFPSSLTSLYIIKCENLESLSTGLQHLTSLQHLSIRGCPKLIHLPETLLPSLLSLRIDDCRKLKERCEGRGSHYWPQISHIPCIE